MYSLLDKGIKVPYYIINSSSYMYNKMYLNINKCFEMKNSFFQDIFMTSCRV